METAFFKAAVVEHTKNINGLVAKLKSIGNDRQEKVKNVVRILDEYELRQLRFIATVHHKVVSSDSFNVRGEQEKFLDTCEWLIGRLQAHVKDQEELQRKVSLQIVSGRTETSERQIFRSPAKILWSITAGIGAVSLLLLPMFCTHNVEHSEWPYITSSSDEATNWPLVIFWTAILMIVCHQVMKLVAKRL